jgi:hypothetical protein
MTFPVLEDWTAADSSGSAATSLTLTKPTGATINSGDLLLIMVANDENSDTAQWDDATLKPSGFTLITEWGTAAEDAHCAAFYRIADTTEGATINCPAQASNELVGWYLHVTGNHASPLDQTGATAGAGASTVILPALTTTVNDCLVFYVIGYDGADAGLTFTPSGTGWTGTEIDSQQSVPGTPAVGASGSFGYKQLAASGSSSALTITVNVSDGKGGFQFAIAPVSVGSNETILVPTGPER